MLARAARYARWQASLALDWASGGARRHRAGAHRRGEKLRRRLRTLAGERQTVVFALTEHFGDLIAAEPLVRAVRSAYPDARLVHVVNERFLDLVAGHPAVDEYLPVRCMSEWYLASGRLGGNVREFDCHVPGRVCDQCQSITRPTPPAAPVTIDDYYDHGSLLDVFAKVAGIDATAVDCQPRLHLPATAWKVPDRLGLPADYLVVHCRSNQTKRDWPADRWDELARRLRHAGRRVVEVGLEPVLSAQARDIDLTGRLSLVQTCAVVARAGAFVGIDSGPAHAANAGGVPGVVLMGHYGRFVRRNPFSGGYADGSLARLVQFDGPIADLPVELAWAAVQERLLPATAGNPGPR